MIFILYLKNVLDECIEFLKNHSTETIIIDFKNDNIISEIKGKTDIITHKKYRDLGGVYLPINDIGKLNRLSKLNKNKCFPIIFNNNNNNNNNTRIRDAYNLDGHDKRKVVFFVLK
ncbi:hypothetical protein LY90DRAFT_518118 [Neocallimastix californiae]|uniref:Uncharacterized protein n=1 Tax=Neocallimastix californiae TaxID=1754190 RepID=A0A1Y1ZUQ2_9FUNG|nr:hypothetical protein LY90DRAFT_518118 [Neocallimastix californiae]|eukprot:ORY13976.1 hypothetical protein LY90DRAFT_518118 [Neocallimastix californiae]